MSAAGRAVHDDPEAGYATVWAAAVMTVLLGLALAGVELGMAVGIRHRAEAAVDLAALAAAGHAGEGEEPACAQAARVAERMSTRLTACRVSGWEVRVELEAREAGVPGLGGAAHAWARAGPEEG